MATSPSLPDYYAVLQVHPDADDEVIAAAYRQLMKKYHPDLAGEDPRRVAEHAARAKTINEAFGVLRDAERRRHYDSARIFFGTSRPATASAAASPPPPPRASSPPSSPPPGPTRPGPPTPPSAPRAEAPPSAPIVLEPELVLPPPFSWLRAMYYLLPGSYEWEQGQTRELLTVFLLPLVLTVAFALVTGRLAPLIGNSWSSQVLGGIIVVILSVPLFSQLPRVAMAVGPTALLLTGGAGPVLQHAHVPGWLALPAAGLLSLMLSARMYIFGVLPAALFCWVLTQLLP